MRKLIIPTIALILSAIILTTASYAWATTLNRGTYTAPTFRAAVPEQTNYIYISNDQSIRGNEVYTSQIATASLLPVTTANCDYFYWEDNSRLTGTEKDANVIRETIYLTSDVQYTKVQVQAVSVTGAGLLANAITRNGHVPVTVYIWIEGTDPACTYEALQSAGNIQVTITLEGING